MTAVLVGVGVVAWLAVGACVSARSSRRFNEYLDQKYPTVPTRITRGDVAMSVLMAIAWPCTLLADASWYPGPVRNRFALWLAGQPRRKQ